MATAPKRLGCGEFGACVHTINTYESTILKGEQADAVYNETVASLKDSLESSTKTYNDALEQLAEYKDAEANNTYYGQLYEE